MSCKCTGSDRTVTSLPGGSNPLNMNVLCSIPEDCWRNVWSASELQEV